jgi:hypothetical protein
MADSVSYSVNLEDVVLSDVHVALPKSQRSSLFSAEASDSDEEEDKEEERGAERRERDEIKRRKKKSPIVAVRISHSMETKLRDVGLQVRLCVPERERGCVCVREKENVIIVCRSLSLLACLLACVLADWLGFWLAGWLGFWLGF